MASEISLSGRVVSRGVVVGLARVIGSYNDLETINEGDIMVAAQTDMNFTPYLEQCVGLITERGGRYCHAAIYSRENQIPCITGIKDARTLIEDGTRIELNADTNEVKYI